MERTIESCSATAPRIELAGEQTSLGRGALADALLPGRPAEDPRTVRRDPRAVAVAGRISVPGAGRRRVSPGFRGIPCAVQREL